MCGPFSGGCGPRRPRAGRGFGFDPGFMAGFWGRPGHRRGGPFRGGRMFEQGDLKYVILQLLDEKPRHGYEIIKALEERSGGTYSPSPGTVYPTLTMLEDMGYARATTEEGGKKIYAITPEGKAYLNENRSTVNDIFDRIAEFGSNFFGGAMMGVNHAFKDLARATYTTAPRHRSDADRLSKIKSILERAAREIDDLERGASSGAGQPGTTEPPKTEPGQGGPSAT